MKKASLHTSLESGDKSIYLEMSPDVILLSKVKTLSGIKIKSRNGVFHMSCDFHKKNLLIIHELGFFLDEKLDKLINRKPEEFSSKIPILNIPGLQGTLRPFQNEGVFHINRLEGNAVLADDMGLGKTIQAISYLQLHQEKRPAVIICPGFLKLNWEREINKWMNPIPSILILSGRKGQTIEPADIYLINYDILSNEYEKEICPATGKKKSKEIPFTGWVDYLMELNIESLILDESHYIKNSKSQRTKASFKLRKRAKSVLSMSGTIMDNQTQDLFNPVTIVNKNILGTFWNFAKRYCNAHHGRFGWDTTGSSNTAELHHLLTSSIMIRRLKSEVLTELPDKSFNFVPMGLNNEKTYLKAEQNFIAYLRGTIQKELESVNEEMTGKLKKSTKNFNLKVSSVISKEEIKQAQESKINTAKRALHLTKLTALKQLAAKGCLPSVIEWLDNFMESGNKIVVFAIHKAIIEELMKVFGKVAVKVDGSTSFSARQKAVDSFQNNKKIRMFIGNMDAAGVGITLTAASDVAIIELPDKPGLLRQAPDRVHRIGQKEAVNVWYLFPPKTVIEKVAMSLDRKAQNISLVLDGKDVDDKDLIMELVDEYKIK